MNATNQTPRDRYIAALEKQAQAAMALGFAHFDVRSAAVEACVTPRIQRQLGDLGAHLHDALALCIDAVRIAQIGEPL